MFKKIIYLIIISLLLVSFSNLVLAAEKTNLSSESQNDLFLSALKDYKAENYALAEQKFIQLLKNDNLDSNLEFSSLYYVTKTAVYRNQIAKAVNYLNKMDKIGYKSANLNWELAKLYLNQKNQYDSADFKMALKYLKKANSLGANQIDFKRDLAYAYLENNELKKAEVLYKEIIGIKAQASDYLALAKINEKYKRLKKAINYYETALKLNNSESSLYLNLGKLYQKTKNNKAAVSIFKKGIKEEDKFTPYYIGLGESYIQLQDYSQAKKYLEKAIELNSNTYYGYFLLAKVEEKRGRLNLALNNYNQALKYNPNYVEAYLAEGQIYLKQKDYYKAISSFSLAVEKNKDYAESRYYLAKAYYQAEMLEAARAEIKKALHLSDNNYPKAKKFLAQIETDLNLDKNILE